MSLNGNLCLNEDFALIGRTGTAPHDVAVHRPFGRTELTDLNPAFVGTGNHEDCSIDYAGNARTKLAGLFYGNRLYVHDCFGIGRIFIGSDNIELHIHYQFLGFNGFFFDAFADIQRCPFDLGFRAAFYLGNLKVFPHEGTHHLFLSRFSSPAYGRTALYSLSCRSRAGCMTAGSAHRDFKMNTLSFGDIYFQHAGRSGTVRRLRCRNRGRVFYFRCRRSGSRLNTVDNCLCNRSKRINRFCQLCAENLSDFQAIFRDGK